MKAADQQMVLAGCRSEPAHILLIWGIVSFRRDLAPGLIGHQAGGW
jgi:hypothetical protein